VKKIVRLSPTDKLLRKSCVLVSRNEFKTKDFQETVNSLLEFVYSGSYKATDKVHTKPSTVGLSANQVGISKRISIVDMAVGHSSYSDVHVLINPEITWRSKTETQRIEGCVNLQSIWGKVIRSYRVKVKALDRSGNELRLDLHGWPAILLQHEIDHLNGILFIDRLKNSEKALLVKDSEYKEFKKLKDNWKKFIDVSKLTKKLPG
jgi:peptide deformylase